MSTLFKPDTSLRRTAEAGPDGVRLRESWLYSTISERNFRDITLPLDFKPKFPDFLAKW